MTASGKKVSFVRALQAGLLAAAAAWMAPAMAAPAAKLAVAIVQPANASQRFTADATVEAVRDARLAAQVQGRVVALNVKAGDYVQAGQVLLRLDQSAASQQLAGSQAQLAQAQAMLAAARGDYERSQRLHQQNFLSKAAYERAQADFQSIEAQVRALTAQAAGSAVQADYYTVKAPFSGWVAQLLVSLGDMASPGLPLLTVYDPAALRLVAQVPESVAARLDLQQAASIELAGRHLAGGATVLMPALDAATHSATVRVDLPAASPRLVPGQYGRVSLPLNAADQTAPAGLTVPRSALVVRGELHAVYVVQPGGAARLRQIRLGQRSAAAGDQVEVLAGLRAGELVALDPVLAAQAGQP
ncbi:efflux RND transporter periplasmic adaptor subunit [Pseudoduganella danionis]|uniref:efflux RND transporter periplasmic adaptor subunit n=1 Tax=Pseudoduganella danionis TaxID=1890295 RepID=UPI0035AD924E